MQHLIPSFKQIFQNQITQFLIYLSTAWVLLGQAGTIIGTSKKTFSSSVDFEQVNGDSNLAFFQSIMLKRLSASKFNFGFLLTLGDASPRSGWPCWVRISSIFLMAKRRSNSSSEHRNVWSIVSWKYRFSIYNLLGVSFKFRILQIWHITLNLFKK